MSRFIICSFGRQLEEVFCDKIYPICSNYDKIIKLSNKEKNTWERYSLDGRSLKTEV